MDFSLQFLKSLLGTNFKKKKYFPGICSSNIGPKVALFLYFKLCFYFE